MLGVRVDPPFQGVPYRFALFENPQAAPNSRIRADFVLGTWLCFAAAHGGLNHSGLVLMVGGGAFQIFRLVRPFQN